VPGNLTVLGIAPTRPETGYGYIERAGSTLRTRGVATYVVRRFTEKPTLQLARKYVKCGRYLWNAGMFFWRVSTFLENLKRFLPATHDRLAELGKTIGKQRYMSMLRRLYPTLENISVDYAILEPATRAKGAPRVSVIPARVGWSDIGSWAAVYELLRAGPDANVSAGPLFALDADRNYFWSPRKFVAAIGVRDLVFVETDDAVLLCSRKRSQDVAKTVKWLEQQKQDRLL
jgi:mannose-1-phosphate guanylyltransferase